MQLERLAAGGAPLLPGVAPWGEPAYNFKQLEACAIPSEGRFARGVRLVEMETMTVPF